LFVWFIRIFIYIVFVLFLFYVPFTGGKMYFESAVIEVALNSACHLVMKMVETCSSPGHKLEGPVYYAHLLARIEGTICFVHLLARTMRDQFIVSHSWP
jgi:hypothetical protein